MLFNVHTNPFTTTMFLPNVNEKNIKNKHVGAVKNDEPSVR